MLARSDLMIDVCYGGHIRLPTPMSFQPIPPSFVVINPAIRHAWTQHRASEEEHSHPALIDVDVNADPRPRLIRDPVVFLARVYPWLPTFDFGGHERIERVVGICAERPWLGIPPNHLPDWIRATVKKCRQTLVRRIPVDDII